MKRPYPYSKVRRILYPGGLVNLFGKSKHLLRISTIQRRVSQNRARVSTAFGAPMECLQRGWKADSTGKVIVQPELEGVARG